MARWLAHELRDAVEGLLLTTGSRVAELGEPGSIHRFVRGEDDFPGNRPQAVWALLMLEIFLRGRA